MTIDRSSPIPVIHSVASLASGVDAWISDIWGVLHNGIAAFPAASEACVRFREGGGIVVLVTNAPRSKEDVCAMLDRLGVPRTAWNAIVTSGDVTRSLIVPWQGRAAFHLGPARQLPIFDGLDVRLTDADGADVVVCTGLVDDDSETPDDYREDLARLRARNLPLICANPDIVVERGHRLVYCAGALAEAYAALGGEVLNAGKPHPPIYARAFEEITAAAGRPLAKERVLAIGDGVRTDIAGAETAGLRSLFVASALHFPEGAALDAKTLDALFPPDGYRPAAATGALRW